jgi:hypothetical protein
VGVWRGGGVVAAGAEVRTAVGLSERIAVELTGVFAELREIVRGLDPAALAEGGLHPAL